MTNDVLDFKRSFDRSGYPADFLASYKTVKCLAHGEGGETLIVESKADAAWYIAKILPDGANDESAILEQLSHPALPRFVAHFEGNGIHIMVREYVDGLPLDEAANGYPLSDADTIAIGVQLCDVLCYLHTQTPPVIHRDVKPGNVILCEDGSVKLIDFGISRTYKEGASRDTVFSGTNDFAPPEQYGFQQTGVRADIYSLGMLLKYLLTGGDMDGQIENRRRVSIVLAAVMFMTGVLIGRSRCERLRRRCCVCMNRHKNKINIQKSVKVWQHHTYSAFCFAIIYLKIIMGELCLLCKKEYRHEEDNCITIGFCHIAFPRRLRCTGG